MQSLRLDEFGYILTDTNTGFTPFGFAGGLYDVATGLVRFGARDYEPRVGRWTAKDELGFASGSVQLYEYASNDPVNRIDLTGLDSVTADPHTLEKLLDLFEKGGSGFRQTERSSFITQNNGTTNCELWPWSAARRTESFNGPRPPGTIAIAHTHPMGTAPQPSPGDIESSKATRLPFYTVTRAGIFKYDPTTQGDPTMEEGADWIGRANVVRNAHKKEKTRECSCSQLPRQ